MTGAQVPRRRDRQFTMQSERLGRLLLVNRFLKQAGLEELLDRYVPTTDARCAVPHARG